MMKKFLLIASLFIALFAQAQHKSSSVYLFCYFKGNGDGLHYAYSRDGYTWKALFNDSVVLRPVVSKDKLFRDPCILRGADGRYHMVWTVSWADKGFGYATSMDLVHWSEQQFIPVMAGEDSAKNTWAPEINYDPKKKEYVVYWATSISGRFPQKDTSAEGQRYNHRMYYVTSKDLMRWTRPKLLYEPGYSVIDASIARDGERYVMFLKNETRSPAEKNIRVAFSNELTGPYSEASAPITGNYWAEGPTSLKIGDEWIVYFDKYRDRKYGAVSSKDLVTWTDISDKVSFPQGARHGTVITLTTAEFNRYFQDAAGR